MMRRGWSFRVANPLPIGRCGAVHRVQMSKLQIQMQCTTASPGSLCLILPKNGKETQFLGSLSQCGV